MTIPLISLIVPIYNVEDYLSECLDSLFNVIQFPIEVILINDGSTDGSAAIAEKYHLSNPSNSKLIHRENGGLSAARNTGLVNASGEWVAFVDSDDYISTVGFTAILSKIAACETDIIAFDGWRFFDDEEITLDLNVHKNPFDGLGPVSGISYVTAMLENDITNFVTVWDKIYRKSVLDEQRLNFVDGLLHEDIPFTFDLLTRSGVTIEYHNEKVIYYRQRTGSIMSTYSPNKSLAMIWITEFLLDLFNSRDLNQRHLNGYIVFLIKRIIYSGQSVHFSTLNRILFKKMILRKKLILLLIFITNTVNIAKKKDKK